MKKYVLAGLLSLLATQGAMAGINLKCSARTLDFGLLEEKPKAADFETAERQVAFEGQLLADCEDSKGKPYYIHLSGIGFGFHMADSYFAISCPLVKKSILDENGEMTFMGVRANAAVGVGVSLALAINKRMGTCILPGVEALGLGAGAYIGEMTIGKGKVPDDIKGNFLDW